MTNKDKTTFELGYWNTTDDPTIFRSYLEDKDMNLVSGVKIKSLRSGVTTVSDRNGLFTLTIPASYRKGKSPPLATDTLVFSKAGYQTIEYRDLILNPGIVGLDVVPKPGSGTEVHRNLSVGNGESQVFTFKGAAQRLQEGCFGETLSFEILPSTFDGGWTMCGPNAKAILKGRKLRSVDIFLYPTGTGLGENGPYLVGHMTRLRTSPQEDTCELPIGNLMMTSFWAQAIDENGKLIESINLGSVGGRGIKERYDDRPET